ncbi:MAG: hypothetical protein WA871_06870 [Candidatus Acidiferrales bacterium]
MPAGTMIVALAGVEGVAEFGDAGAAFAVGAEVEAVAPGAEPAGLAVAGCDADGAGEGAGADAVGDAGAD